MARVLLDTDILSEIIKKKDATVAARATSYLSDEGRFTVSVLSVMEIVYGFHRLGREDRLEQFRTLISAHEVLPFEMTTATLAGRIYADLERQGTPVGLADVMIAAVALHHGLPIVTGNTRHFKAVLDAGHPLEIQNWRASQTGV
jgi:tRNA(fMet)-specific endonuclease VapC